MNNTIQPNAFQGFYDNQLTSDEIAEMKFNFVNYIEMLIEMDSQHKNWLGEQAMLSGRDGGEKVVRNT